MTPVTLAFGPSVSLSLLTITVPGLACYAMYRVARLWLRSQAGAIAAGAFFGLSSMLDWQDWYHLQLSAGVVLLPVTLEVAVRPDGRPERAAGFPHPSRGAPASIHADSVVSQSGSWAPCTPCNPPKVPTTALPARSTAPSRGSPTDPSCPCRRRPSWPWDLNGRRPASDS